MGVDGFIFLINVHFGEKVRFSIRRTFNSPIVFEFKTRKEAFHRPNGALFVSCLTEHSGTTERSESVLLAG